MSLARLDILDFCQFHCCAFRSLSSPAQGSSSIIWVIRVRRLIVLAIILTIVLTIVLAILLAIILTILTIFLVTW